MTTTSPWRNRRPLLLLSLLFLAPLAFSFWLYYASGWRPGGTTNHGELLQPRALEAASLPLADGGQTASDWLTGKWSLVVIGNGACDAACQQTLVYVRQTHTGLGRLNLRVQRVFLADSACCERGYLQREHAGVLAVDASSATGRKLVSAFPSDSRERMVFVVDPLGNLMMRYDSRLDPRGLRTDLKKLLDLSHIG
jgi:hypothetical protein